MFVSHVTNPYKFKSNFLPNLVEKVSIFEPAA